MNIPKIMAKPKGRTSTNFLKIDVLLVVITAFLLIFGLVMVYSSSWNFSILRYDSPEAAVKRQFGWAVAGVVIASICTLIDYRKYKRFAIPILLVTLITLFLVVLLPSGNQDTRGTLFGKSVQPSELAKLAIILYLSVWLYSKKDTLHNIFFGLIPLGAIIGLVGGLILIQPDLSAALSIILIGGVMFFMANSELRQFLIVFMLVLAVGALVIMMSDNGRMRIIDYWNGLQDPIAASDHIRFSLRAIVEGGLLGKGLGKGSVKVIGLPVAWTDSIYAVIAEEFGLIGSSIILGMYILLMWRGMRIAHRAPDMMGKLMAGGITFWITFEAMINMGVMVNLFPFAGNPLPFISTGGSSLISTLAGIGILLNISRHSVEQTEQERRTQSATYSRRRRYRRRNISSTRRTPGV